MFDITYFSYFVTRNFVKGDADIVDDKDDNDNGEDTIFFVDAIA